MSILGCHARAFKENAVADKSVAGRIWRNVLWVVAGTLMSISFAWAQQPERSNTPSGCSTHSGGPAQSVAGTVLDPSGAVVPGISISLTCGGVTRTAITGTDGQFGIVLPPGRYQLGINAKGFSPLSQELPVEEGVDTSHLNFHLKVAQRSTTVNVTARPGYLASQSTTGTKTDTPLIETPQSISVVTRQQMDDQQPQNLNQALRYTPGIVPESSGVSTDFWSGTSLLLRGFIPETYQDGLEDDTGGNDLLDSYFYQSVNVLAGPASVLYGQASPAAS